MVPNSSLNKVRQENMAAVSIPRLFFLLGSKFGQTFVGACPGSCLGRSCQPQLWHGRTNLPIQSCNRKDKWKESGTDKFPTKAWKARLLQCGSISVASVMLMQHAAHSGVKTYRSMQYAVCSTPHAVRRMSRWNPNDLTQIGYIIPVVNGSERDGPNNTGPSQQKIKRLGLKKTQEMRKQTSSLTSQGTSQQKVLMTQVNLEIMRQHRLKTTTNDAQNNIIGQVSWYYNICMTWTICRHLHTYIHIYMYIYIYIFHINS